MSHLHRQLLHDGPLCSLAFVRCRHPHGGPGEEEEAPDHALVLPVAGLFLRHVEGRRVVGSPAEVLFFTRGEAYRVSHPTSGGDDCLSLAFADAALLDVLAAAHPEAQDHPERPFARQHLAIEPAEALAFHALRRRLAKGHATDLEAEERSLALLASLARRSLDRPTLPFLRAATRRQRRDWTEAVQLLLAKGPGREPSLAELGRAVACSPFHLARCFQAEMGLPIHRYALRQRLLLALERLAEDGDDLTGLALDLGFASHSHFSAAFQRAFGLSPSAFRMHASGRRMAELRKNVKA